LFLFFFLPLGGVNFKKTFLKKKKRRVGGVSPKRKVGCVCGGGGQGADSTNAVFVRF